jgi:hypothetical protein
MRTLLLTTFVFFIAVNAVFAQNVDPNTFAPAQRQQLVKCFSDMLSVVKRHNLRDDLANFLYAACAPEIDTYRDALRPFLKKAYRLDTDAEQKVASEMAVYYMVEAGERLFKERPISFCSGDACALDNYRKCLFVQIPNGIDKHTKPPDFEQVAQRNCAALETTARAILTIDFSNARKLQGYSELNEPTRKMIEKVVADVRHEIVVTFSEDLIKVEPGRKSCKREMCGNLPCATLGGDRSEYECAIDVWPVVSPLGKAVITFKLVNDRNGPALTDTTWTVMTLGGDVIKESAEPNLRVTLEEGDYVVIARKAGKVYNRNFQVKPNLDREIEVIAK